MSKPVGLCFRCEWRARFLEDGMQPRCECGDITNARCACYMYRPVRPVALEPIPGETRSLSLPAMLAGRGQGVEADVEIVERPVGKRGVLRYWRPRE